VGPRHPWRELLFAGLLAGCLPPDGAAKKPAAAVDADAALIKTWVVADHILGRDISITRDEAEAFHGRRIEITKMGYVSPWQGTCEEAGHTRRTRMLAEVIGEVEAPPSAAREVEAFGLTANITEYRLSCTDARHPPPLTMFVSNDHAMTCFNGVCYLLKPS